MQAHLGREPIGEGLRSMRGFGAAKYPDEVPSPTWGDLQEQGRLGATCDPVGNVQAACGGGLVCRKGLCRHCIKDSECPSLHSCVSEKFGAGECRRDGRKAWERATSDPYEFACSLFIFSASALAAAAGIGGGGMFVPLLVMLSGLKADLAVPLSQSMILCGSIINLSVFLTKRHPDVWEQPLIDYDCVVLLEPMLCLGVTAGVILNRICPQWLLLLLLCVTLGSAMYRTLQKGLRQFAQEQCMGGTPRAVPDLRLHSVRRIGANRRTCCDKLVSEDFLELTDQKAWQVILTVVVWLALLASSFHGSTVCSKPFAAFLGELAALLLFCTYVAGRRIQRIAADAAAEEAQPTAAKAPFDWTAQGLLRFPAVAFGAGCLGGLLGLGGGVIMSPLLLEVGMHSEAVQATTAVFVFLSSSLATIQFAHMQLLVWHYAIWYGLVTVAGTALGQHVCDVYVRKRGRYSIITLAITGVLLASLVALTVTGAQQVMEDFYMGRQMWFSTARLCNQDGMGIVAIDIAPADSWPSDLPRWKRG